MSYLKNIVLLISIFLMAQAAAKGQSTIKAVVDKNKIMLGEIFQLSIEASITSKEKFILPDSIPHFEFASAPVIDSTSNTNGMLIKAIYQLTSFDSGRWSIPSISLTAKLKTDTIPIDVVFSEFDPNQEYHDIKDIIEVDPPKKKMKWWWFVAGGILLATILYSILRKKTRPLPVAVKSSLNPYEEAIKQLNELKKQNLTSKQFHSAITDIFRNYVFNRRGIRSLQKTTADLVIQLKELEWDKTDFEKLAQTLRLSDFVKFAKYEPSNEDNEMAWTNIRDTIEKMENKP